MSDQPTTLAGMFPDTDSRPSTVEIARWARDLADEAIDTLHTKTQDWPKPAVERALRDALIHAVGLKACAERAMYSG